MTDWVIIDQAGTYLTGFTDEHGQKKRYQTKMENFPDHAFLISQQTTQFKKYISQQSDSKIFGENKYGNPSIRGQAYSLKYEQARETTNLYLAEVPFSMSPFYLVEKTNADLRLPINLAYAYLLPANNLVVSEYTQFPDGIVKYELKAMSAATHFLDINDYTAIE